MNAPDFQPHFPSRPGQIEGVINGWQMELDGEITRSERPFLLTLRSSEVGAQEFYEKWVNAFVQNQCKRVAPPAAPAPPEAFGLFDEGESSAWAARVKLFENQYPSWVSATARKAAAWGNVNVMQDAVTVFAESCSTPSVFDPLRLHLACFWTTHYLWLMSDMHGTSYLKYGIGITVSEAAYEKARRELRLVWNRTERVIGVFNDGSIRF